MMMTTSLFMCMMPQLKSILYLTTIHFVSELAIFGAVTRLDSGIVNVILVACVGWVRLTWVALRFPVCCLLRPELLTLCSIFFGNRQHRESASIC